MKTEDEIKERLEKERQALKFTNQNLQRRAEAMFWIEILKWVLEE